MSGTTKNENRPHDGLRSLRLQILARVSTASMVPNVDIAQAPSQAAVCANATMRFAIETSIANSAKRLADDEHLEAALNERFTFGQCHAAAFVSPQQHSGEYDAANA